jgi:hypothetical protein
LPVNFRPQACHQHEVEGADGYAVRSVPVIVYLVPDFSVMTLGTGSEGDTKAVLMLSATKGSQGSSGAAQEDGSLEGLLWEISLRIRSRSRLGMRRDHALTG